MDYCIFCKDFQISSQGLYVFIIMDFFSLLLYNERQEKEIKMKKIILFLFFIILYTPVSANTNDRTFKVGMTEQEVDRVFPIMGGMSINGTTEDGGVKVYTVFRHMGHHMHHTESDTWVVSNMNAFTGEKITGGGIVAAVEGNPGPSVRYSLIFHDGKLLDIIYKNLE